MSRLLERLGLRHPVVQAGMGGGLAGHELAGAVSSAGGLGTIGMPGPATLALDPHALRGELRKARERTGGPIAVNLLLPFAGRRDFELASDADAVVTFWGRPRRRTPRLWLHQAGSVEEARAAYVAGADGAILQGVEAGGHVRGKERALDLLERARAVLPPGWPLLVAGGIAERADVGRALEAGADAAVLGTRFLMSDESGAAAAYKQRLMESRETVLTELFGAGWPVPHRVIWNEAAERHLAADPRGPAWMRAVNRIGAPLVRRTPMSVQARLLALQRPGGPLLSPAPASRSSPRNLLDAGPLYAGESVARIHDIRPAADLVRELAP